MDIDPASLSQPDRYKLLIGGIVPRPIAWVSTVAPDGSGPAGRTNLAPFSFFSGVGSNPLSLLFCPALNERGEEKDTLRNAKPVDEGGVGEFVVSVATHALARKVAATAEALPHGESEFEAFGLTPAKSRVVRPPRVMESPLSFECVTERVIRLNPGAPAGGVIVIGRIVSVHAAEGIVNERHHIDPAALDAIGRMGGFDYCTTRERFQMPPGRKALDASSPMGG
ncbi:MAG: flavin reductase family protein [Phycisphaerales bacterium]|nr:MAG: flavin reductase family protein [Phycisphaerales bacterium]